MILLIEFVLCSESRWTKFIDYKCFYVKLVDTGTGRVHPRRVSSYMKMELNENFLAMKFTTQHDLY